MYGWRARIGNILPTACVEILPYEFYRVALERITFVTTHWWFTRKSRQSAALRSRE